MLKLNSNNNPDLNCKMWDTSKNYTKNATSVHKVFNPCRVSLDCIHIDGYKKTHTQPSENETNLWELPKRTTNTLKKNWRVQTWKTYAWQKPVNFANKNKLLVTFAVYGKLCYQRSFFHTLSDSLFLMSSLHSLHYFLAFCQRKRKHAHYIDPEMLISICWSGHIINYFISFVQLFSSRLAIGNK